MTVTQRNHAALYRTLCIHAYHDVRVRSLKLKLERKLLRLGIDPHCTLWGMYNLISFRIDHWFFYLKTHNMLYSQNTEG